MDRRAREIPVVTTGIIENSSAQVRPNFRSRRECPLLTTALPMQRYVITDRRHLFRADESYDEVLAQRRLVALARFAAREGIDYIQLREKDLTARQLTEMAAAMAAVLSTTQTRLLINDRFDVALAARAHGVHLTTRSLPARVVRRCVPADFLIAVSTHNRHEIAEAEGFADFAVCGPVFPSGNKPVLGVEAFAELARSTSLPLFALGGITHDNTPCVLHAGAAGIAAIRTFAEAFLAHPED